MLNRTPLADLILTRMQDLGLGHEAVGRRLGYENAAKAAGRVYAMLDGNVPLSTKSRHVIKRLPEALEVPSAVVVAAVARTDEIAASEALRAAEDRQATRDREEAAWRATFVPHAILHTSRTMPTQITACGLTGGTGRWLTIRFDVFRPPITFVEQALTALPTMTRKGIEGRRGVMFFGQVLGFVINYDPDRAVRFDLTGAPLEVLPKAYRTGEVVLSFGGRPVDPAPMARVLGLK